MADYSQHPLQIWYRYEFMGNTMSMSGLVTREGAPILPGLGQHMTFHKTRYVVSDITWNLEGAESPWDRPVVVVQLDPTEEQPQHGHHSA